jgi:hypothetical protein
MRKNGSLYEGLKKISGESMRKINGYERRMIIIKMEQQHKI